MAHLKNLFTGSWSFGSLRNDGVWIPAYDQENPTNNVGCTEFIQIDASKPATFSWAGWSTLIPSDVTIHSYHSATDSTSYAKVVINRLSQTVVNNSITFENADGADFIRLYFHGAGSARQYIPIGFQITQAGVFDDVAFKVIVKNDGISDIIFKTLMLKGEAGGTISSIEKTSSVGVVDTYTITLNDGNTSTFEVTNGSNIESIEKTATSGLIDTYTVTLTNGDTTTFEVKNGEDAQLYELPEDCIVAYDKEPELHSLTGLHGYVAFDAYGIKNVKVTGYTKQATTTGKNLFNPDQTVTNNSYLDANGAIQSTTGWKVSDYIEVNSSTNYYFNPNSTSGNNAKGAFYDSSNNFISSFNSGAIAITTPSNCQYIRFSFRDASNDIQLELGSSATSYEEYTGGKPSPNPDFPQDIIGYGTKELDGTYTIDIEVIDNDDNTYNITASGLAYPLYDGDVLDFENSKVIRANGHRLLDGSENWVQGSYTIRYFTLYISDMLSGNRMDGRCDNFRLTTEAFNVEVNNSIRFGWSNKYINICSDKFTDMSAFQTWLSSNNTEIIYPLATPTEESVTISGDTSIVENLRGWTQVDAWDEDVTLDVWYYSDVEFPDGYEEVGLPIDDLLYYQDQEYIEFPTNWGFAMGYVFDADEVRFMINVTKDLHDGFRVVANRSLNLALSIYTGSGGGSLTGFNLVDASFIREYGQIQLRLQTETAHGLTVGSLLGARVSQGRLRITFEED